MEAANALVIVRALADGVDPQTGEVLPDDGPFQHPQTVRALYAAAQALEFLEVRQQRESLQPAKAGKPWDEAEDVRLRQGFAADPGIAMLARAHERTDGAVRSRLEKLGLLAPA